MNRQEAVELITYTGEKWGAAAAIPADPSRFAVRVQVWLDALGDIDGAAARAVLAAARDEFPPNVAEVRRRVFEAAGVVPEIPSWEEFWRWVRLEASRATRYLYDGAPPLECPWPAVAGLVTVAQVAQWGRDGLSEHDLEMVLQAHLRRSFESRVSRVEVETVPAPPALEAFRDGLAARGLPSGVGRRVDELGGPDA